MRNKKVTIGIIGGSGIYGLLKDAEMVDVATPYGKPSDQIALGEVAGRRVAFINRHGEGHTIPPHKVNYRANIYALHKLGAKQIIAAAAVGSLRKKMKPGDIVITNQFIDRTKRREDTFVEGPEVKHLAAADVYDDDLRQAAIRSCQDLKIPHHAEGTVVVFEGPRFSSRAESAWYKKMGWDILSMTQYPENVLAAELNICYVSIGMVTDYDVGIEGESGISPVTFDEVMNVMKKNAKIFEKLVTEVVAQLTKSKKTCRSCKK